MHDVSAALLPDSVYHAHNASSGIFTEKRAKIAATCDNDALVTLLDGTWSAAFGHQ